MQRSILPRRPKIERSNPWLWMVPLLYVLAVGLYIVTRFEGRLIDSDSALFTQAIRTMVSTGRLSPEGIYVYPNGFAYQAISTFIVAVTGLDVPALQQLIYPLTAALVVLPAWVLFREMTESALGATIATMVLYTQPEFLFVLLRSSHEKFTRTLLFLCFFWLFRSLKVRDRPRLFTMHVALFYVTAFVFITSNNLLAHSFIVTFALALLIAWLLEKQNPNLRQPQAHILQRFLYVTLTCLALVYLFTFYVYTPAQHDLLVLQDTWNRIAALFLDVQTKHTNAYAGVSAGWTSLPVYFMVSIANWLLLLGSFVIWVWQGFRWLWRKETPPSHVSWLVWIFYAAFATQGGLSIIVDASGAIGNLQQRIFSSFAILAAALVAPVIARWRPRRFARPIGGALALAFSSIALLSVWKASNEPLLSNKWTFYRANEMTGLIWGDAHLNSTELWTEYDERLVNVLSLATSTSANDNAIIAGPALLATTRNALVTDLTRLRSERLLRPLPVPLDALRVYDNGEAQLYHLRPQNPFDR